MLREYASEYPSLPLRASGLLDAAGAGAFWT